MVEIDNLRVTLPLKDVLRLYDMVRGYSELVADVDSLMEDVRILRAQISGLRVANRELQIAFGDLRRDVCGNY